MPKATSTSAPRIRLARPQEADTVAKLLRAAVPPAVRPLTIFGQHGLADWIRTTIRSSTSGAQSEGVRFPNSTILVTTDEDTVCGAAEWRRDDSLLFLNAIAVSPSHRNRGRGRRLLHSGLLRFDNVSHIALDVFEANVRAHDWYERLDFTRRATRNWLVSPLDVGPVDTTTAPPSTASLQNASAADTQHERFGFSTLRFTVSPSSGPASQHEVGRLGSKYFRITNPSTLASPSIRTALLALNPSRSLLYLASNPPPPLLSPSTSGSDTVECKACSVRMRASASAVDAALANHRSPTP